jgi:hypothetical protein
MLATQSWIGIRMACMSSPKTELWIELGKALQGEV